MKTQALYLALFCLAAATATDFNDCGSSTSNVLLSMEGCTELPCIVEKGKQYTINITFTPDHLVDNFNVVVTAKLSGLNVPWPGFDRIGCNNLVAGQSCPLPATQQTTWTYIADILPEYPQISTVAKFRLFEDDSTSDLVCLEASVRIV